MTAVAVALLLVWAAMIAAPDTLVARTFHHVLVQAPARRLLAIQHASVVAILLAVAIAGAAWAIDYELLRVAAMAAPDAAIWLSLIDAGTLVEIGVAALAAVRMGVLRRVPMPVRPRNHRRVVRMPQKRTVANDDGEPSLAA